MGCFYTILVRTCDFTVINLVGDKAVIMKSKVNVLQCRLKKQNYFCLVFQKNATFI